MVIMRRAVALDSLIEDLTLLYVREMCFRRYESYCTFVFCFLSFLHIEKLEIEKEIDYNKEKKHLGDKLFRIYKLIYVL